MRKHGWKTAGGSWWLDHANQIETWERVSLDGEVKWDPVIKQWTVDVLSRVSNLSDKGVKWT